MLTLRSTLLALLVSVAGATLSIDWKDYLIIATASSDEELNDPPTFTSQFADLGADFMTMSYPYFQDNVHLDTVRTHSLLLCTMQNPAELNLPSSLLCSSSEACFGVGLTQTPPPTNGRSSTILCGAMQTFCPALDCSVNGFLSRETLHSPAQNLDGQLFQRMPMVTMPCPQQAPMDTEGRFRSRTL